MSFPNHKNQNAPAAGTARGANGAGFDGLHPNGSPFHALLHALEVATGKAPTRSGKGVRTRCPCCGGKSEKVSITEAPNGSVLLHAFCNCTPADVLASCGLTLADLYPVRLAAMTPEEKKAAHRAAREAGWSAALNVLGTEATVIEVAATTIERAEPLTPEDIGRVRVAVGRIHSAREVLRRARSRNCRAVSAKSTNAPNATCSSCKP